MREHSTRESALVEMIELRRRILPWLRRPKPANLWPMFELWRMPEAIVLDTVESFLWIADAGLSDKAALETLAARLDHKHSLTLHADTIRTLVVSQIKAAYPSSLPSVEKVIDQQVEIANAWARNEIQSIKSKPPFPPIEWLEKRVDIDEADVGNLPEWKRIKMRFTEHDELWTFSSPAEYWAGLAGRAGVALVRNGRPIAHVTTLMN